MYIKIENKDKTEFHEIKSYFANRTQEGVDLNIVGTDNDVKQYFIGDVDNEMVCYIMNSEGKTIDKIYR